MQSTKASLRLGTRQLLVWMERNIILVNNLDKLRALYRASIPSVEELKEIYIVNSIITKTLSCFIKNGTDVLHNHLSQKYSKCHHRIKYGVPN